MRHSVLFSFLLFFFVFFTFLFVLICLFFLESIFTGCGRTESGMLDLLEAVG